ncbi:hypothetical protein F2Q69_00028669 [Brassica cretica]|uniref:Uncharacterized protein n=1 Tax=Brassica cretica TaxID=69181 RepID=A0A8S9S1V1_BRACR|nr:hypothetical protein F2Q69_00028669 [Brassica cretica]
MAARSDEQMSLLLSSFDQIDEVKFVDTLGIYCIFEIKRLKKLHTKSLNNFVDQLEHRTKCHVLKEELKRVNDEKRRKEHSVANLIAGPFIFFTLVINSEALEDPGTRIHASVGEQLIKKYDDKLREGDAIVVQLFKVYDAIVPEKYFADFTDILGGNLDHSCLVGESVSYTVK